MLEAIALLPICFGVVERAFRLARSGQHRTFQEIAEQLRREGYIDVAEQFSQCPSLAKQLRSLSVVATQADITMSSHLASNAAHSASLPPVAVHSQLID